MSDESLAEKVNAETPWWAKALDPKSAVYLAAGIVGVPSLMAIGAGYFIASSVTSRLATIDQSNQTQIHILHEHSNEAKRMAGIVLKFIDDDLRCQYITCLNSAQTPEQRKACISPVIREQEYGIIPPKAETK